MAQPALHKLDSLTTLRFFAAAMIVIHHSAGLFGLPPNPGGRFQLDQAVSFFFILSGFILTYVYPSLTTWADRRRFWLARFARVWPAHFAAFILLWLILQHGYNFPTGNASRSLAVLNLALVHAWVPVRNVFFSFNSPSWTLSTEMAFYLLFPFLIWNWRKTWWIKLLGAFALAAGVIVFCRWANLTADNPSTPWSISNTGMLYIHPLPRLFEFTIGMTTALLFQRTADKINLGVLPATFLECSGIALVLLNMYFANNMITTVLHLLPRHAGGRVAHSWSGLLRLFCRTYLCDGTPARLDFKAAIRPAGNRAG